MPRIRALTRIAEGAVLAGTCALVFCLPRLADACGASLPELRESVPADGDTYPANAALLFWGDDISVDAVTVTVDGEPAALVHAEFAQGLAPLVVKVEPEPLPGQTVVVAGEFCGDGEGCQTSITFTAGERDVVAPVPIIEASFFAVLEHAPFSYMHGCTQFEAAQAVYVHLEQAAPAAGEALVVFQVTAKPDEEGFAPPISLTERGVESTTIASVALTALDFGSADGWTEVCLEVLARDAAGNAAPPFELCPPCFMRSDDTPLPQGSSAPPEPVWTEADAVPGSTCAPAAETTGEDPTGGEPPTTGATGETGDTGPQEETSDSATGGEDGPEKGCACDSDGAGGPGSLLLLALGLIGGRRRR